MTVEEKQTTVKLSASTLKMNTKSEILDDDMSAGISDMLPDQFKNGYMELKIRDTKATNKENIASWVVGAFFEIEKNYGRHWGVLWLSCGATKGWYSAAISPMTAMLN